MAPRHNSSMFNFHIPQMEEASQMNNRKKDKLRRNLQSVIGELNSFTERIAGNKEASSSTSPLSKTDELKTLLEALSGELTNQLEYLGESAKLSTDDEKECFEQARGNVMTAWTEYQKVWAKIVQSQSQAGPSRRR